MSKFLKFISIIAAAILVTVSCSEKEGTYSFHCYYSATTGIDSTVFSNCVNLCRANNYFKQDLHHYFGKYSEQVVPQAKYDFFNACLEVGDKTIADSLKKGEQFIISLVDASSASLIAYTTWISSEDVAEKKEDESVKAPSLTLP